MQIESLKVFCDLAETKSFTKAAALNDVTQSAVSQTISGMERIFKSSLVERSKKQMRITPEGELLYKHGKEILRLNDSLLNHLQDLKEVISGSVQVATIYSIGLYDLTPLIRKFMIQFPPVAVHVELLRSNEVYDAVFSNTADIGLIAYPRKDPRLEIIPMGKDPLVLICHPQHPLAQAKITIKSLQGERFISFKPDVPTRQALDMILEKQKVEVQHVMEFDNVETLKRAVEMDSGIAIVPRSTVVQEAAQNTLAVLSFENRELSRPLAAIHMKNKVLSPAMKEFLKMLREESAGN